MKFRGIKIAFVSMIVTLLAAGAILFISLSLTRMENTMKAGEYTLFSMDETGDNLFQIKALDKEYLLDLSQTREFGERIDKVRPILPPDFQVFTDSIKMLSNSVFQWVKELLCS